MYIGQDTEVGETGSCQSSQTMGRVYTCQSLEHERPGTAKSIVSSVLAVLFRCIACRCWNGFSVQIGSCIALDW